ncbi:hypothetical protein HY949_01440 [Candidatus Gottesmanbacteria bacterium]|nr:hypothetical protein [Candidatus Gottesmanbacteria bacterium]
MSNEEQPMYSPEEQAAYAKLQAVLTHDELLEFDVYLAVINVPYSTEIAAMKARSPDLYASLFEGIATVLGSGEGKTKLNGWRNQGVSNKMVTELLGDLLIDKIHAYMDECAANN